MENYAYNHLNGGGGIIVTYKCTASCIHCCYSSSPKRSGEYMSETVADDIFAKLKRRGCRSVHIGGGEPFINFDKLCRVLDSAKRNGVIIDYIETNASWCVDRHKTYAMLNKLSERDVDCLLISIDPFHNEFIPFDRVKSLIQYCDNTGMSYFLWQNRYIAPVGGLDASKPHSLKEYAVKYGEKFIREAVNAYGMGFNGRAITLADMLGEKRQAEYYLKNSGNCNITSVNHFHVDLNKDFIPPGCMGFRINLEDLYNKTIDKSEYPNFLSAADDGLNGLYRRAESLGFKEKPEGYSCKCALCFDIKKYISEKEKSKDLGPSEFFAE